MKCTQQHFEIKLTQGKVAIVDEIDYNYLNQFKWHFHNGYAQRSVGKHGKQKRWPMQNVILGILPEDMGHNNEVDHIDRNGLNNCRMNLRKATRRQNAFNRKMKNNTSGHVGVNFHHGKYQASIRNNGKLEYLGRYKTLEEAAQVYLSKRKEIVGF